MAKKRGRYKPRQNCLRAMFRGIAEGDIKTLAIDKNDEICGYEFVHLGKFMDLVKKGVDANEALKQVTGSYGRFSKEAGAVKYIDPRKE